MKLLFKRPEERYQSAYGLLCDLIRCSSYIEKQLEIVPFEIACEDEVSRFRLPQCLFGREMERETLRDAFERTLTGASTFVIVSGRAGSGKTALIQELQVPVIRAGGRFLASKCDLLNRATPFEPILQALRGLIRQVWSESSERVVNLKIRLAKDLGPGAGVIARFLPEAATLLGDFPAVEQLPPAEAATRFRRLLPLFINVFTDREHPLVLFLDDLQWADPTTLDVLHRISNDLTLHGLFVVGAFREESADNRDNQVAVALSMNHAVSVDQEIPKPVQHIVLGPLSYIEVRQFMSHILNENTARVQ